jgi:hypothetical protein
MKQRGMVALKSGARKPPTVLDQESVRVVNL